MQSAKWAKEGVREGEMKIGKADLRIKFEYGGFAPPRV